jgi:hypothetical protein
VLTSTPSTNPAVSSTLKTSPLIAQQLAWKKPMDRAWASMDNPTSAELMVLMISIQYPTHFLSPRTVRGRHMQAFMNCCCILAHPDANHHLRRQIKCLMAHCLRVTAAVALFNSGEDEHMIAFRHRWNSDAVHLSP